MHSAPNTLTHFRASTCGDASRIGSGAGPLSAFSAVPSSAFFLRRLGFAFSSCSAFTSTACPAPMPACPRLATSAAACALLPGAARRSGSALTCAALAAAARRRFGRTASVGEAKAAAVAARAACRPRFGAPPATVLGMCLIAAERSIKSAGLQDKEKYRKQAGAGPLHVQVGREYTRRSRESFDTASRRVQPGPPPARRSDLTNSRQLTANSCRALRACLPSPR